MAIDSKVRSDPVRRRLRRLTKGETREEAIGFVRQYHREAAMGAAAEGKRVQEVTNALGRTGEYRHTPEELAFGARVAWRNHARCIGRLFWKSLEVVDCRDIRDPDRIATRLFDQMREAWSGGRIQPIISIFAPATTSHLPVTVESPQIFQYAGYLLEDGTILGDRKNLELTRSVEALGWRRPSTPSPFDLLPLVLRTESGQRLIYEVPPELAHEVEIRHPRYPALGELGLRWYAIPCVSNMVLTIGGIDYPCAPFAGWYMATEIASRDLTDLRRYDLLPAIADALEISRTGDPLWQDRALTEFNHAVLASFQRDGVSITDHHAASRQFMEFVKQEQAAGRFLSADWSWIVPPQASSACPVFHLPMQDRHSVPNYYTSRAEDGRLLTLDRSLERRRRWRMRYDRLKRRIRNWRRERDWPL